MPNTVEVQYEKLQSHASACLAQAEKAIKHDSPVAAREWFAAFDKAVRSAAELIANA